MNYNEILKANATYPSASFEDFVNISKDCVKQFPNDKSLVQKLENGFFTVNDYQNKKAFSYTNTKSI